MGPKKKAVKKTTKKVAKKVVKKVIAKSPAKNKSVNKKQNTEIVIRVEQPVKAENIIAPIEEGGKYMIPKNWMSEKQVLRLLSKTPQQHIYTRPGRGKQVFHYVTGQYIEKVLNYVFAWNWDFEVVNHGKEGPMVWVLGKLTVKDDHGHTITKSQFGRADIKFKSGTKDMLDFGNDLKAATTDALKKCASLLGIASDVYGKTEYKQETGNDVREEYNQEPNMSQKKESVVHQTEDFEDHVCTAKGCGEDLTEQEAIFSKRVYGKELCRDHQKEAKKK